jgi:hypothetical protein
MDPERSIVYYFKALSRDSPWKNEDNSKKTQIRPVNAQAKVSAVYQWNELRLVRKL